MIKKLKKMIIYHMWNYTRLFEVSPGIVWPRLKIKWVISLVYYSSISTIFLTKKKKITIVVLVF